MAIKDTLVEKIVGGVALAAALGGGGTVLTNWHTNGQQDVKIERALHIETRLDSIERKLDDVHADLRSNQKSLDHLKDEQDRIRSKIGE